MLLKNKSPLYETIFLLSIMLEIKQYKTYIYKHKLYNSKVIKVEVNKPSIVKAKPMLKIEYNNVNIRIKINANFLSHYFYNLLKNTLSITQ